MKYKGQGTGYVARSNPPGSLTTPPTASILGRRLCGEEGPKKKWIVRINGTVELHAVNWKAIAQDMQGWTYSVSKDILNL